MGRKNVLNSTFKILPQKQLFFEVASIVTLKSRVPRENLTDTELKTAIKPPDWQKSKKM